MPRDVETPRLQERDDAGKVVPGEARPGSLDPPGHNCQRREAPGGSTAVGGAAGRPETSGAPGVAAQVAALLARGDVDLVEVEWWADLEHVWRVRRAADVERLQLRARRLRELAGELDCVASRRDCDVRAGWAEGRARSQAMGRQHRLATCRRRWVTFGCGCQRIERPVGCDATLLCDWCRRRHLRRWRRRITKALGAQQRAKLGAWKARGRRGSQPSVYLVTLTTRHTGDVSADREALWNGWRAWQKWLTREVGGAFPYAAVWEVTAGRDERGHVHCHVAAVLPWFDWSRAHAAWREACPTSSNVDFQRVKAEGASKYLSKYVTKGVQPREMPGALAGEVLASWYGKRKVSTSRAFWRPLDARGAACCRRCEVQWSVVKRPSGLTRVAPESVWFATAELAGLPLPRGPTQVRLRFDVPGDAPQARAGGLHGERP